MGWTGRHTRQGGRDLPDARRGRPRLAGGAGRGCGEPPRHRAPCSASRKWSSRNGSSPTARRCWCRRTSIRNTSPTATCSNGPPMTVPCRPAAGCRRAGISSTPSSGSQPLDEAKLDPADNTEEFEPVPDDELEHYRRLAERLATTTDKALFCTFGGLTFGDIALVPATFLPAPKASGTSRNGMSAPSRARTTSRPSSSGRPRWPSTTWSGSTRRLATARPSFRPTARISARRTAVPQRSEISRPVPALSEGVIGWIHRHTTWKTFMHCCGGIAPLLDAVVEAEFDILTPVQCSAKGMDSRFLKRTTATNWSFGAAGCWPWMLWIVQNTKPPPGPEDL